MREGNKVTWVTASGVRGSGRLVSDVCPEGPLKDHAFVAVDAPPGEEHRVIFCATTWLSVVEERKTL